MVSIPHLVQLSCYSNVADLKECELCICEPHMYKEAMDYVRKHLKDVKFQKSASSVDAILETRKSKVPTCTIAGAAGESMLHVIDRDIVKDNTTTFSLCAKK